jgi:hypothetical protein
LLEVVEDIVLDQVEREVEEELVVIEQDVYQFVEQQHIQLQ